MGYKSFLTLLFVLFNVQVYAQSVPVTFNVNMSYQIEQGNFDPNTETVDIAGSFNGWGSTQNQLFDADDDSIYSVTIDGFTVGETIQYKFRYNFEWGGREEFPGAGNNRVYTVESGENEINVWYNDEVSRTGPPQAAFDVTSTFLFNGGSLRFENLSLGNVTNYDWYFEEGTPERSNDENPVVRFNVVGTFDVQLIASNETEADTLFLEDFITVEGRELGEPKWWNDRVFYEIFVRSFYDSDGDGIGDFQGIIEKMDYLNDGDPLTDSDLGITGIWLMPINPSPSYHGYDVTDYKAINPDYGTVDDFKEFLDLAHDRGIAVIIDFVMNHTSTRHPWFEAAEQNDPFYRDFYRWENQNPGINGPWGQNVWHQNNNDYYYGLFWSGMPDINYDNEAVKDSMFAASDFWINEIGIDGFRQDAVLYIHEVGDTLKNTQKTLDFWQEFNLNVKSNNPDAFNVGEAWEPTDVVLKYITNDRMDYAFEFDLANAILGSVINENAGSVTGQMEYINNVYPFLQYGTFLTNHDQNRLMSVLNGNVAKNKLAAAIYLTLPGIPYIYYGEEIGQLGVKPDEDIRRPLQWSDELSAGFSTDPSPWRAPYSDFPTKNIEAQQQDPNSLWSTYRDLIKLRERYAALRTGPYEASIHDDDQIYAFRRTNDFDADGDIIVLMNLSSEAIPEFELNFSTFPSQIHFVEEVLYSSSTVTPELDNTTTDGWRNVRFSGTDLRPYSIHIYRVPYVLTSNEEDLIPDEFSLSQNFPNPFNPTTNIQFEIATATDIRLRVYDITGRLIQTLADGRYSQGQHTLSFDASSLSSGIYIYSLETPSGSITKKMTLIK